MIDKQSDEASVIAHKIVKSVSSEIYSLLHTRISEANEDWKQKTGEDLNDKEKWSLMARVCNVLWVSFYQVIYQTAATDMLAGMVRTEKEKVNGN
jgi:hypothetical protein